MTEAEKRRHDLLNQTRNLYQDRTVIPAVHPRYGGAYEKLYGKEEETSTTYFKMRVLIAFAIFVLYAGMDYTGMTIGSYKSEEIAEVLSQNVVTIDPELLD